MFKLNGHLFQIYNVTDVKMYPNGIDTQRINCDSYVDYERNQKIVEKYKSFSGWIYKNPDPKKISINAWRGTSSVVYFDSLDNAVVYKALANQQAKIKVFEMLDKMKTSVEKQVKKINIANVDIINKYPEFFL